MIKLKIINRNNKSYDITQVVQKVTWSGDYKQAARKLEFSIISCKYDKEIPQVDIQEGYMVYFYEDNEELFRGFIYTIDKDANSTSYMAYDHAQKLVNIKVNYNFKNKTAQQITTQMLNDYSKYGLKKGTIVSDGVKWSKIFIGVSMYDTIMSAYTNSHASNGKEYMCYAKEGKIYTALKGAIKLKVQFKEKENIISTTYKSSIENVVNKVLIVDDKGNKVGETGNSKSQELYGLFQEVIKQEDGKDSNAEAKKLLKDRERSASLDGYGDPTCITGYGVTVTDSATGLTGLFYIDTDSHTWENGHYKIQLNLNYKNLMNEVTAGEDEQKETVSGSGTVGVAEGGSSSILNGKKVKAQFTAYYPGPGIEGGYGQSMGGKLDPSKKTCAAPKSIPFRTKIQCLGTGTSIDGQTYTVTDRGGAIIVDKNGVYHIDILMSNAKECNAFGRRNGYIIIGNGTGYTTTSTGTTSTNEKTSDKASKLISVAKSKLGAPYVWGASGTKSFDCSSFTQYVYKTALGINLQRTSNIQGEQGTKITSVSKLQPGDLIYFNTYSTNRANGITHVGMYIGNGQMIHASYSYKKVMIVNLNSYLSYKGTKFIWARRHI